MLIHHAKIRPRVSHQTILSAIVMLIGIVLLLYSNHGTDKAMLYAGLSLTFAGVVSAVLAIVLSNDVRARKRTLRRSQQPRTHDEES